MSRLVPFRLGIVLSIYVALFIVGCTASKSNSGTETKANAQGSVQGKESGAPPPPLQEAL